MAPHEDACGAAPVPWQWAMLGLCCSAHRAEAQGCRSRRTRAE